EHHVRRPAPTDAARSVDRDQGDPAPLPAGGREGQAGPGPASQPLVARALPPDRSRHHHAAHGPGGDLLHRPRLPGPPARGDDGARSVEVLLPGGALGRRVPRAPVHGAARGGGRCRHPARAVRPHRPHALPRGPCARDVRPAAGDPLLARAERSQPHAGGVRRPLLRQDEPGPPLLAHLRPRRDPLLRQAGRPRPRRRPGHARGVLAR
ncbi:MAG: Ava_C0101 and related proteins, partial [uncultured Nocardioides sp.]